MAVMNPKLEKAFLDRIRSFQKANQWNKRCSDCTEVGPTYICMNYGTFVCTACSGLHRELTHKVKGVSMSKWSEEEVEFIVGHGNQVARETFMHCWSESDMPEPDPSQPDRVRRMIKAKYVDKMWVAKAEPPPDFSRVKHSRPTEKQDVSRPSPADDSKTPKGEKRSPKHKKDHGKHHRHKDHRESKSHRDENVGSSPKAAEPLFDDDRSPEDPFAALNASQPSKQTAAGWPGESSSTLNDLQSIGGDWAFHASSPTTGATAFTGESAIPTTWPLSGAEMKPTPGCHAETGRNLHTSSSHGDPFEALSGGPSKYVPLHTMPFVPYGGDTPINEQPREQFMTQSIPHNSFDFPHGSNGAFGTSQTSCIPTFPPHGGSLSTFPDPLETKLPEDTTFGDLLSEFHKLDIGSINLNPKETKAARSNYL
eukprot:GHVN01096417.1.p1 GENE.GHVN01096417.1~~GHVN01096417.1.p1  ORF type:complete len:424 (-),score=36.55 GHVN01096417.1:2818-4089(-)